MASEKYKKIICFGEVLWDMLPSGAKPGGAPLNCAIHLKRQGIDPILVSRIGKDITGEKLIQFLSESKIDTKYIQTDKKLPTSQVLVNLDKNGNATYDICEPVAWDNITYTAETEELAANADLIIYGSLASRNKETRNTLLSILKNSAATRLVDINLRSPYDKEEWIGQLLYISDFVKLNDDELLRIAKWNDKKGTEKELINWLAEHFNCPTVCVTRGSKGAVLFIDGKFYEHPGLQVNAVDTVGAGDSFLAGLVAQLSKNRTPSEALEFASATGAFVASSNGAVPLYSQNEIRQMIKNA